LKPVLNFTTSLYHPWNCFNKNIYVIV
jgi:hypothetical protein